PAGRLGPYDLDETGAVRDWLVLGPFANRKDKDGLYDHDLLKTEAEHQPAVGLEVATRQGAKLKWTRVTAPEGKLLFRSIEPIVAGLKPEDPGIAYAACWLNIEREAPVKLRVVVDQGCRIWL